MFSIKLALLTSSIVTFIIMVLWWSTQGCLDHLTVVPCHNATTRKPFLVNFNTIPISINTTDDKTLEVSSNTSNTSLLNTSEMQSHWQIHNSIPIIFTITPTYARETQKAELTRLCQTFMNVKSFHWIIIEDSDQATELVTKFLEYCPVKSTQLNRKTSSRFKHKTTDTKHFNRGATQRNIGLDWLRDTYKDGDIDGVVYFADDDNTYDIRLFEEMRYTNKVSVWPVAFAGGLLAEGPKCKSGRVTGFHTSWAPNRKFPIDMAAFAVNLDIFLKDTSLHLNPKGTPGYLESDLLSKIITRPELEARANDCTQVYVWHTETKKPYLINEKKNPTLLEV